MNKKITQEDLNILTKNPFKYKCICYWSKNDEYGFIPNSECPVHGKETKKMLKKTITEKSGNASKEQITSSNEKENKEEKI